MISPRLRLRCPIDRVAEVGPLLDAGADELFAGVLLGDAPTSCPRRLTEAHNCLGGLDELAAVVAAARPRGAPVFVALNHPRPTDAALALVAARLPEVEAAGASGVIVSNLPVLRLVQERTRLPVVAGSYFGAMNPETVRFLAGHGVQGVVLDRQVTERDLRAIAAVRGDVELEAFVYAVACRSQAFYCHRELPLHDRTRSEVHPCGVPVEVTPLAGGQPLTPERRTRVAAALRLPRACCGLCALFTLREHDVAVGKLVGRGFPLAEKLRQLRLVRAARDLLGESTDGAAFRVAARALREADAGDACLPRNCYYPHFGDGRMPGP
jgi:collagenase-like PrtC family protease